MFTLRAEILPKAQTYFPLQHSIGYSG